MKGNEKEEPVCTREREMKVLVLILHYRYYI